ncbi:MAG: hypothetical protein WAM97_20780 [Acidimicrobiales bacterium]
MRSKRSQRRPKNWRHGSKSPLDADLAAADDSGSVADAVPAGHDEPAATSHESEVAQASENETAAPLPPVVSATPEEILGIERPMVNQDDLEDAASHSAAKEAVASQPVASAHEAEPIASEVGSNDTWGFEDRAAMATEVLGATSKDRSGRTKAGADNSITNVPDLSVDSEEDLLGDVNGTGDDVKVTEDVTIGSRRRRKLFGG